MKPTARRGTLSGRSFVLACVLLLAELSACARSPSASVDSGPVVDANSWSPEVTVNTCDDFAMMTVGSYVLESNCWNKTRCPGTQCMAVNSTTGAFSVTQGPNCGSTVASYPNVLYGCSFGTCSPASLLPMPVSALSTVTSSWDFSVAGSPPINMTWPTTSGFVRTTAVGPTDSPVGRS